jgi:hypothetical protein
MPIDPLANAPATIIIKNTIVDMMISSKHIGMDGEYYYCPEDIQEYADNLCKNNPDRYDEQWYPLVATFYNQSNIDWQYLADYANEVITLGLFN